VRDAPERLQRRLILEWSQSNISPSHLSVPPSPFRLYQTIRTAAAQAIQMICGPHGSFSLANVAFTELVTLSVSDFSELAPRNQSYNDLASCERYCAPTQVHAAASKRTITKFPLPDRKSCNE